MPPSRRPQKCQVCNSAQSKYTCAQCSIVYCSVPCYKQHKENSCNQQPVAEGSREESAEGPTERDEVNKEDGGGNSEAAKADAMDAEDDTLEDEKPLRPLTSLNWPYIPEESAYPDPLKRDDPKVLQLRQYEAIATSPAVRKILANQNLRELMISVDKLRGREREQALQKALGVTRPQIDDQMRSAEPSEEVLAFRELAEAIEAAVRGQNQSALGLDWGD